MVNNYDFRQIKNRFGGLLSSLHDTGFTDEYITHSIITNPFFDMFEKNDLSDFENNSIMQIVTNQFHKDPMIAFSSDPITDYIWAGEIYITIMLNYRIPLKQLFVICPLGKMIEYFPLYHEMHNIEICKIILEQRKTCSILNYFRSISNVSIRKLSFLTGINNATLTLYEKDNDRLFAASNNNILKLAEALNVSLSCLKQESSFIPFTSVLFNNNEFQTLFIKNLFQYNHFESEHYFVTFDYLNEKEYKELLKEYKTVVSLYLPFTGIISFISNRVSYKMLSDIELNLLYNKTLKELYIPECPLIF